MRESSQVGHFGWLSSQAPAYHGNSGGPVLDANGNVVGSLIAGAADPNTGQLVAGEQFVLPAGVIASALAAQKVHPAAGAVTTDYNAALRDYFNGYYSWALAGFQRVLAIFPDHPYAAQYARLARQQIAAGHDRTPKGSFPWLVVVLLVLVAAAAIGGGLVARSRGRRQRARQAAGPGQVPGGPWPPPPPGYGPAWPPPPPPRPAVAQPAAPAGGSGWPPPPGQPVPPANGPGLPPPPSPPPPGQPAPPMGDPRWPAPPPPETPDGAPARRVAGSRLTSQNRHTPRL